MCYTGDLQDVMRTQYTLDYYLNLSRELVKHGIHVLAIKASNNYAAESSAECTIFVVWHVVILCEVQKT